MHVSKTHKAFANGSSANIKFSKTQLSKFVQLGGFIGVLDPFLNSDKIIKKVLIKQINFVRKWYLMIQ